MASKRAVETLAVLALLVGFARSYVYYCPQNDDNCGWELDPKDSFCYKKFSEPKTYQEAQEMCNSFSFVQCPSTLLEVKNVPFLASTVEFSDGEMLRIQASFNGEFWNDLSGKPLSFPEVYSNYEDKPKHSEYSTAGDTAFVEYSELLIGGNITATETFGFICQGCRAKVPICPRVCDNCADGISIKRSGNSI